MSESAEFQRHPRHPQEALVDEVRALRREVSELRNNLLKQAGVGVKENRLVIGQSLDVEGELLVTGLARLLSDLELGGDGEVTGILRSANFAPGQAGWRLTSTGLEVNTLTAKDALIGDQALANPVAASAGSANTGTAVSVGTSAASFASVAIPVPAGYSRAFVTGISSLASANAVAAYIATRIDGADGMTMPIVSAPNGAASGSVSFARQVTGLSGGSLTVQTRAYGSSSLTAYIVTSASAVFLR